MTGLLGGWWGVAAFCAVLALLARELIRALRGDVMLTVRQKVVRSMGGVLIVGVMLMAVFSPVVLARRPGVSRIGADVLELGYWGICLGMASMAVLMAILDLGEISREFTRVRKDLRRSTLTPEDVQRLLGKQDKGDEG
ncbi:MAG TPA: hypothetical protein VGM37_15080 [Armatimonadota bacterium]|jgi:hypothetical protein